MDTSARASFARLRRLTPFVAPFLPRLIGVSLLSLFGVTLGLLWPLFTKVLIDNVLLAKNLQLLYVLCGAMTVATAVGYGVGALNRYYYTQITARILFDLRLHLFAHLQSLSFRFHVRAKVGDLLSRLNTDISEVQSILTDTAFALASNVLVLLVSIGFLVWLDWRLFLISLIALPAQLYGVMKVRPRLVTETRRVRELNASIASFLVESLSAIRFIKVFAIEKLQLRRLEVFGEHFVRTVTRFEMLGYWGNSIASATTFVGGILTALYGGYLVISDQLTIGALIAFSAYQSRAFSPLQALVDLYLRFERAGVALDRIFEFIDVEKELHEWRDGGLRFPLLHGAIEFRSVSFAYESNEPLLSNITFSIPPGGRLTILGPSGAGKSTIVDLLARLYAPDSGVILLDGYSLMDFDLSWLRDRVVVISQETTLFHVSLLENLRYANPEASLETVSAAAQVVGLHEFISTLPQGYDTIAGERGARLSTGQRQRLALARAVLKEPDILVLDEALSGIDIEGESQLRAGLAMLMRGKTILTITHRVSSVLTNDQVLVLERGKVVWTGKYGELASSAGNLYVALKAQEQDDA